MNARTTISALVVALATIALGCAPPPSYQPWPITPSTGSYTTDSPFVDGSSYTTSWKPATSLPIHQGTYQLSGKQCSACRRSVSLSCQARQRCPHCGAYWSFERTVYR